MTPSAACSTPTSTANSTSCATSKSRRTCARAPDCTRRVAELRERRAALRTTLPRFTATPAFAERIRAAVRAEDPVATMAPPRGVVRPFPLLSAVGLAASLAFAALFGYAWGTARARTDRLLGEAIDEHVRSLQVDHLTDVASTDQHTVKPWFAGKLAFSPPVVDLASAGFPLVGGRLERIGGQPAAALVFHRRSHAINVFVWPAGAAALGARTFARDGYSVEAWSQGTLNFLAVSEIPAAELATFAAAFRAQ